MDPAELERRLVYHPPTEETRRLHDDARALTVGYGMHVDQLVGGDTSREMSLFFTALEEASFWLHAHIARNRQ